jgi:hypothetical protein
MKNFKSTTQPKKYSLIALYWLVIVSAVFFLFMVTQDMQTSASLPTNMLP